MDTCDVVIVGAGPAGLMAACGAARRGLATRLVERNPEPGVKILMSGGGHCNLTHATDARGIADAFGSSGRFLRSALAALDPAALVEMMDREGVPCRTEPGGKVLPASDRAGDVLAAVTRRLARSGATLLSGQTVVELAKSDDGFRVTTPRSTIRTRHLILTTGGQSYPGCGTTGDGYRWAAELGHTIVAPRPALVPIVVDVDWVKNLQGITLPDVVVRVVAASEESALNVALPRRVRPIAQRRGSLLFAHFGLSGPVALDLSRYVSEAPRGRRPMLVCDLLPEVAEEELGTLFSDAAAREGSRSVASLLGRWLPRRLAESLCRQTGLPPEHRLAELPRGDRNRLARTVKQLTLHTTGTLGFEKAEVTAGGVALDEIDSRTMQSKQVPGLFIAGELLDLDGPIGGFNLQAAFSTGHLAGQSVD
ncbi:MAG: NAD(P)/FAD-dependent oxidoreductase [Pirellulales bacterium]|nr:NAD(P)/FAD-dependent oxidoreductase [Pirellulales bacterium]